MPNLCDLAIAIRTLMEAIDDQGGEISDEQVGYLDQLEGTVEEKVDVLCAIRREKLDQAAGNRAEAKRQIEKAVARENAAERKKADLMKFLVFRGEKRIETTLNTVRIQKNSQPSVRWTGEPGLVPTGFRRVIPEMVELDKKAVVKAWREKKPLPGGIEVELGQHVVIE